MTAYLDNAATTPIHPEVVEAMLPFLTQHYGNPSSIHQTGRTTRVAIEKARKTVAQLLGCTAAEIFFTSGGTESDNMAIIGLLHANGCKHIITSALEHHASLHAAQHLQDTGQAQMHLLKHDAQGVHDLDHLASLLQAHPGAVVSLMHANNEIGNINPIAEVAALCAHYGAYLHTDAVQTMGKLPLSLDALGVHTAAGAAHKFHGPKGIGVLYVRGGTKVSPYVMGGAQERNMRGGTENVAGIMGLARALEMACETQQHTWNHCLGLKQNMLQQLRHRLDDVRTNGLSAQADGAMAQVLNVSMPPNDEGDMLLFNLDIAGVAASGGSACSSGSQVGSHVIAALNQHNPMLDLRVPLRFSFSKYTTNEEVAFAVDHVVARYQTHVVHS